MYVYVCMHICMCVGISEYMCVHVTVCLRDKRKREKDLTSISIKIFSDLFMQLIHFNLRNHQTHHKLLWSKI